MNVSFTTTLETFNTDLWGHHVVVPTKIAEELMAENGNRRVVCRLNDTVSTHSALMPSGGAWFILVNKKTRAKLGLLVGQKIDIQLESDTTEYGMPMPEEFGVLLDQDEEGNAFFQELTPGKQRSLIYIVSKVKNTDSRINKALAIMHHLKEQNGEVDFKRLNETIKEYNQRGHRW